MKYILVGNMGVALFVRIRRLVRVASLAPSPDFLSTTQLIMNNACKLIGLSWRSAAISAVLALGVSSASAFVLGPTTPGKWGSPVFGTGATVTYSYMATGVSMGSDPGGPNVDIRTLSGLGAATWEAQISAAFAAWSAVANITFVQVADDGAAFNTATTSGDIRIGAHAFDGPNGTLAHGFYPPTNGSTAAGDIHFDSAELWKAGFGGPGFDIFTVMAHEIGHAIGLDHTGVANSLMNSSYTEAFSGLQADDIAGAQFIYGARQAQPPTGAPDAGSSLALLGLALLGLGALRRRVA